MAIRVVLVSLVGAILAVMALTQSPAASQTAAPAANASPGQIPANGVILAELAKSVDSKKTRAGDKIDTRVTMDVLAHGEIVIPRGTKITGRVINARAQSRTVSEAVVEIAFDRVTLKNGRELPLRATIQAVGRPARTLAPGNEGVSDMDLTDSRPPLGRNAMRHNVSTAYPGSLHPGNSPAGSEEPTLDSRTRSGPSLGPASHGVVGIKGMVLSNTAQGSAIRSTSGNVHLSKGTQLALRVLEAQVLLDSLRKTRN